VPAHPGADQDPAPPPRPVRHGARPAPVQRNPRRRAAHDHLPAFMDQGTPGRPHGDGAGLPPCPAALRPPPRLRVHLAERRRLPHPSRQWAGHSVEVLLRIYARCVVGQDEPAKAPHQRSPRSELTWARIGHSDLHFTTPGRAQPHPGAIEQDHRIPVLPQVKHPEPGLSNSGAGGARTHDRRIMSPLL
jgi:hypothetical protein